MARVYTFNLESFHVDSAMAGGHLAGEMTPTSYTLASKSEISFSVQPTPRSATWGMGLPKRLTGRWDPC
jgi:hypothetical protein